VLLVLDGALCGCPQEGDANYVVLKETFQHKRDVTLAHLLDSDVHVRVGRELVIGPRRENTSAFVTYERTQVDKKSLSHLENRVTCCVLQIAELI
jgi:hypothetical protein